MRKRKEREREKLVEFFGHQRTVTSSIHLSEKIHHKKQNRARTVGNLRGTQENKRKPKKKTFW